MDVMDGHSEHERDKILSCTRRRRRTHDIPCNKNEVSIEGNRRHTKCSQNRYTPEFSKAKRPRVGKKQQNPRMSGDADCSCSVQNLSSAYTQTTKLDMGSVEDGNADMEKEFIPHKWSTKFQMTDEVLQQYLYFITEESEVATDAIPNEIDVVYSSFTGQKLDLFGTDLPDDAPILAFVHGGFWKEISKDMSRFPAVSLHKAGVKTFVIGYNQRRKATLWDMVDQVEDAINYVLKYAEEKNSRGVYLAGHCGGAHLIAKALGNYELFDCRYIERLNGVFLISGLYDLRNFCLTSANDAVGVTRIDAISFSPLYNNYTHLEHSKIRFYILAAEEDSPTFKSQSRSFYGLLLDICPMENVYLEIKDEMDHFDMVTCLKSDNNYLKNLVLHDLHKHRR